MYDFVQNKKIKRKKVINIHSIQSNYNGIRYLSIIRYLVFIWVREERLYNYSFIEGALAIWNLQFARTKEIEIRRDGMVLIEMVQ